MEKGGDREREKKEGGMERRKDGWRERDIKQRNKVKDTK